MHPFQLALDAKINSVSPILTTTRSGAAINGISRKVDMEVSLEQKLSAMRPDDKHRHKVLGMLMTLLLLLVMLMTMVKLMFYLNR